LYPVGDWIKGCRKQMDSVQDIYAAVGEFIPGVVGYTVAILRFLG
jgi:hypothetical protein